MAEAVPSRSLRRDPELPMPHQILSIQLPTGVTLEYVDRGRADGIPVMLIHGFADSWRSFESVLDSLPHRLRAIVPSLRGHGASSQPTAGYAISDFAADIGALHDVLGLRPAVLVGHSLGSAVALRLAIDAPNRTRGLVLAGATPTIGPAPAASAFWNELLATLTDPVDPGLVRSMTDSMVARPVPRPFLDMVQAETSKVRAAVWRSVFEARWRGEGDYASELERVVVPTLVIWGERDPRYSRADQDALVAAIPDARLEAWAGAGHALHWEEPARFAAEIVEFVGGLRGRGSRGVRRGLGRSSQE